MLRLVAPFDDFDFVSSVKRRRKKACQQLNIFAMKIC